ncbi:4-demethylwyosine synthase TYW1 [Methanothermococcus sp. Ax23]|uniref:4-demethylwyosine synthase TYW1 n=1 Tax=Methanothermococcus sp. Ax23 TaxID=3156486 RepID=UPI003B9EF277
MSEKFKVVSMDKTNQNSNKYIPEEIYNILRKQHYQIKDHSAVKLCGWVRKSLLENKNCYKSKFYGIATHRCIQCTPSAIWCQQSCIFCWRVLPADLNKYDNTNNQNIGYKLPEWKEPEEVMNDIFEMHRTIIMGYKGILDRIGEEKFSEAINPKHVAISLSGEPTVYPYLKELIELFHKKGLSTFVVSNGILTDVIAEINPTQLYVSLDAYDLDSYKKICGGKEAQWEKILNTLDILESKKRTCLRTTLIRNYNDDIKKFVPLYERANTNFIELKSYMNVGYSRKRLNLDDMLKHDEIINLSKTLEENSFYKLEDDSFDSRVSLLVNENRRINPKIKFDY